MSMKVRIMIDEDMQGSIGYIEASDLEDMKEKVADLIDSRVLEIAIKKEPPILGVSEAKTEL